MTITLEEIIQSLPEERRQRIDRRAAELIAEEMHLRELRRLRKLTQTRLSKKLKIGQEGISRMEKRADMYISTLRGYVEGVGGKLSLVVEFPDHPPVILAGLGIDEEKAKPKGQKKAKVLLQTKVNPQVRPGVTLGLGSGLKSKARKAANLLQSA